MLDRREVKLRLFRLFIMFLIALAGIVCFFVFPERGIDMAGSAIFIAISYMAILYYPKGQWIEALILLGVFSATICSYVFPNALRGYLSLPQILYFFYAMGKFFIIKLKILKEFGNFPWLWKRKLPKK